MNQKQEATFDNYQCLFVEKGVELILIDDGAVEYDREFAEEPYPD
jgi:hypothetical protein